MNEIKYTGGPAFPNSVKITNEDFTELRGMTLRDYFAAKAINRIGRDTSYEDLAKHAYAIADAMLKARNEK